MLKLIKWDEEEHVEYRSNWWENNAISEQEQERMSNNIAI
jgi:hypothetical protein